MDTTKITDVYSDLIDLPETQMRRDIDRDELYVLAENIKQNGLINPITVRRKGERFELVAGQRRLLAMRIAGIIRIPCVVRDLSDVTALNVMAAENLERRDVDLVDESNFILRVMTETNTSIAGMAERLNRSEQFVKDRLLVAEMPDYMQGFLKSGELKLGVALALIEIEPDDKRRLWVGLAVQDNVSVRTAEYWAHQHRLGTLPGAVISSDDVPNAPAGEYRPAMLRCAVDGKEYLATECQAVFVFKGNVQYISALREELGSDRANVLVGGVENPTEAPLGPGSHASGSGVG